MHTKEIQLISHLDGSTHSLNVSSYPDGTPMVADPNKDAATRGFHTFDTMVLRPKNLDSFVTGMFAADALAERGQPIRNLVIPFVPGARQDRLNPVGDFLFTAKSVARMINERNFDRVVLQDPHSTVIAGLIDRAVVAPLDALFNEGNNHVMFFTNYDGIISPDAGAGARTREFAEFLQKIHGRGFEVVQAFKHRDVDTGKLSGFEVTVQEGKKYLVVDDICDGGGTFVGLGQQIVKQGAKADLFVTHGIFSKGTNSLTKIYNRIVTTDSTLFEKYDSQEINTTDWIAKWTRSL